VRSKDLQLDNLGFSDGELAAIFNESEVIDWSVFTADQENESIDYEAWALIRLRVPIKEKKIIINRMECLIKEKGIVRDDKLAAYGALLISLLENHNG
jgi:hypothetical protein